MLGLLKVFGRGIVTTLALPLILLTLVCYGVYCLVLFVIMFFKGVIDYFSGKTFNADLPEDIEARRMVLEKEKSDEQAKEMLNIMYQSTMQKPQIINPSREENTNEFAENNEFSEQTENDNEEDDVQ